MHVIFLVLFCVFWTTILYYSYKSGYDAAQGDGSYFGIILLSVIIFVPIALVCLIVYLIILCKSKIKGVPLIVLFVFSFLMILLISAIVPSSPAKGYYDYVNENVDIAEIHQWLIDYEFNKYDQPQFGNVFEDNWPECIKKLNPRDVKIYNADSVKYAKVIYFFGPSAAFGLCVMEEPVSVPPYDPDYSDTRIELSDNAFVWYN
jgi:hypothetical protein